MATYSTSDTPTSSVSGSSLADEATGSDIGGTSTAASIGSSPRAQRVVQGAHQAVDRVAARTVPAVEQWMNTAAHAGETLNQQADRLGELQEQWVSDARETVRQHPLASVFGALVLGMLVARLTAH